MKKISLTILISLILFMSINAQSSHLTFKNVPIDGSIYQFTEKMKNSGFTLIEIKDDIAKMEGEFVNKSCELYIISSPRTHTVWKIIVYLPEDENWYSLKNEYFNYLEQYKKKYGALSKNYEFFSSPYYEGDGYEIQALSKEKCHYASFWNMDNGSIVVEISKYAQIRFTYEDAINVKITSSEKESKVQSDI